MEIKRVCAVCKIAKPFEDFVKDKRKIYGIGYYCRDCEKIRTTDFWIKNKSRIQEKQRERYWANREKMLEKNRNYYKKYGKKTPRDPLKEKARSITKYAIKLGHIVRQPCEVCGESRSQSHHTDYDKPLEIMWLCKKHHMEWHRNNTVPPLTNKQNSTDGMPHPFGNPEGVYGSQGTNKQNV